MADHRVARVVIEFPPGVRCVVRAGRLEASSLRMDKYYALYNVCAHQFGPQREGKITGTLMATAEADWRPEWVHESTIVACAESLRELRVGTCCFGIGRIRR